MNLLFLTPQLPYPPMQGTTLRNFHLMRELARRHSISLLTFVQPGEGLDDGSPLGQFCREIRTVPLPSARSLLERGLATLTSPLPDMALRLPSRQLERLLLDWVESEAFDAVQVEGIEMAAYGLALRRPFVRLRTRPRLVFDDHNAEYLLQRSAFLAEARVPVRWHGALYSLVQWRKLKRYEREVLSRHDAVAAVSPVEAQALEALRPDPAPHITVVPNGVDTEEFAPMNPPPGGGPVSLDLVFTGKMDYRPNVDAALWFAEEVLPRVRAHLPQARFVVCGQQPDSRLAGLSRRGDASSAASVLTGRVPDVRPYIARATVYVAPLRMGSGTHIKVLQAMSMAVPIVSTTLGCAGLGVEGGREAMLADTPPDMAQAILRLAGDEALRRRLGERARQFVVERYDWRHIAPLMEQLYLSTHAP